MTAWKRGIKPSGWFPRRAEVCLISLDKERPALIISNDSLNAHSLDVCVIPISTVEHKAFSLRPRLQLGEGGLHNESWAKCDQPTTVEKQLLVYPPLGTLSAESMRTVEVAVKAALELP
jgi:mRNA-degrading endonuclease toxin of MazEF toxin-antitoxin module